jgi:uncharacterized membrane protein YbaN (DUF454 family)
MLYKKILLLILAVICIILGVLGLILPIMPGFVFLVIAAILLSRVSYRFRTFFDRLRLKYAWIDRMWNKVDKKHKK